MKTLLILLGSATLTGGILWYVTKKKQATSDSPVIKDSTSPPPPPPALGATDVAFETALNNALNTVTTLRSRGSITDIEKAMISGFINDCKNMKSKIIRDSLTNGVDLNMTILYCANEKYKSAYGKYLMPVPHNTTSSFSNFLIGFPKTTGSKNNFIGPVTNRIYTIAVKQ